MSRNAKFVLAGAGVALLLAIAVAPFASSLPDGLEWVVGRHGAPTANEPAPPKLRAPLPDYQFPFIASPALATGAAGAVGVLIVLALALLLPRIIRRRDGGRGGASGTETGGRTNGGGRPS